MDYSVVGNAIKFQETDRIDTSKLVDQLVSDGNIFDIHQNDVNLFSHVPVTAANRLVFLQQQNPVLFDPVLDAQAGSVFLQQQNPDNCNFLTLEQFLKEETELESVEQLIKSNKEIVFQIIKDYFQKCVTPHEHLEPVQLILLVVILVSIFSQQFGGSRDLPVA